MSIIRLAPCCATQPEAWLECLNEQVCAVGMSTFGSTSQLTCQQQHVAALVARLSTLRGQPWDFHRCPQSGHYQLANDPISRATHTVMLTSSLPACGFAPRDTVIVPRIVVAAETVRGHVSGGPHGFDLNTENNP